MKSSEKKTAFLPFTLAVCVVLFISLYQRNKEPVRQNSDISQEFLLTFPGNDKLKLGLTDLMVEYETRGVEAAMVYAQEDLGLDCQKEKCFVQILTKGDVSDDYIEDFEKIGVNGMNTSSLSNIAGGYLTFEQMKLLASQDFVYSVSPPSTVIAE